MDRILEGGICGERAGRVHCKGHYHMAAYKAQLARVPRYAENLLCITEDLRGVFHHARESGRTLDEG